MKLTYGGQTIDLFDREIPGQILLSLSGGLDSASLFYLICKHFPNVDIITLTSRDVHEPFDALCAVDIVQFMRETFPNANINKHYVLDYDGTIPSVIKNAEDKWESEKIMIDGKRVQRTGTVKGLIKVLEKRKHLQDVWDKYDSPLVITGMTKNPPMDEMIKYGFADTAEVRRTYKKVELWGNGTHSPYMNIDKRFVAGIYKDEDLMDTLYPITGSCVGNANQSNYFTEECGTCFWCHEKRWAFQ